MTTGASLHPQIEWHSIPWRAVYKNVRRLQTRIVKALQAGNKRKVRALQFILTRSFSGKAVAVRRVTENQGKNSPGIDNIIWNTSDKKTQAITNLKQSGYRPKPLKRIYIPKSNGKLRPLSIPVMADRAMQALHLLALDPIAETLAEPNSYGFRKERSPADAIGECFLVLSQKGSAQYILEGDIKSCFDEISHEWILANVPMNKIILKKWLKAGYIYQNVWYETISGTPQGGIISPVIMNLTLNGLEKELETTFSPTWKMGKYNKVYYVRFADDLIITGRTKELLANEVKPLVETFLKERGLKLSSEKTKITHISDGFDFLGQNTRKYKDKLLIKPSQKSVQSILMKIGQVIEKNRHISIEKMIWQLNPILRGWANYHRHIVSKKIFVKIDRETFLKLWRWAIRRHPKKSKSWIKNKYFKSSNTRQWNFQTNIINNEGKKQIIQLFRMADVAIKRHVKIKGEANPYDSDWEVYFEKRLGSQMLENLRERKKLLRLWFEQDGICPICSEKITKETRWHIHHIRWRSEGGKETMNNLVLLHPDCHRKVHNKKLEVVKPRSKKRAL